MLTNSNNSEEKSYKSRKDKKINKIIVKNEYKIKKTKALNNVDIETIKSGKVLNFVCLFLSLISCFMTVGGNYSYFIGSVFALAIYVFFVAGISIILFQVSKNIYTIKKQFKQYYFWSLLLQYSMLIYSVFSNYKFLASYITVDNFQSKIFIFIPSFLLDVGTIFFIGLSIDQKKLNYHSEKIDQVKDIVQIDQVKDENIVQIDQKNSLIDNKNIDQVKNIENVKSSNSLTFNGDRSINIDENKRSLEIKNDRPIYYKKPVDNKKIDQDDNKYIDQDDNKKTSASVSDNLKTLSDNLKVINYISDLTANKINVIKVSELINETKISERQWKKTRDLLINEGKLQLIGRKTYIKEEGAKVNES